ncbi:MAG: PAS domain S-box protein [Spartobacteria bacterium]|nr:PAS domain S-box protein [Spartobacteria bacterium]
MRQLSMSGSIYTDEGNDMHAMRVMEERNAAYRILYDTVLEVEGRDEEIVPILCMNLCQLAHAQWGAVALYDAARGELTLEAAMNKRGAIKTCPVPTHCKACLPNEWLPQLLASKIHPCSPDHHCLFELFAHSELFAHYRNNADLAYYSMSCTYENELLAWFVFGFFRHQKLRLKDIIETYLNMAGIIIQRIKRTQALRIAHARNEQLLSAISSVLIVVDAQGIIRRWNPHAEALFGLKAAAVEGTPFAQCPINWDHRKMDGWMESCRRANQTVRRNDVALIQPETGKKCLLNVTINPYTGEGSAQRGTLILAEDMTQCRILEQQALQVEKLKSVSRLAGSVAHEINTPAQFINDNITFLCNAVRDTRQLICDHNTLLEAIQAGEDITELTRALHHQRRKLDLDYIQEEMPRAVEQTLAGIERIAGIVQAMKELSCADPVDITPTSINQMIENALTVSRGEWHALADVVTDLDPRAPVIACNPVELNHVLLNLLHNAARAIEQAAPKDRQAKGEIRVTTRLNDEAVEIAIRDTGCGIPEDVKSRMYDPFFTTREDGPNLGQGLAEAFHVVVEKNNGHISCESAVGKGTTFTISLPRVFAGA